MFIDFATFSPPPRFSNIHGYWRDESNRLSVDETKMGFSVLEAESTRQGLLL